MTRRERGNRVADRFDAAAGLHDRAVGPDDGGGGAAFAQPAVKVAAGAASTTAAPRLLSWFRCASVSGEEVISANRFPTTSSNRRPSLSTGLGHSVPASPPGVRDLITSRELRSPGATPSAALVRVPGRRRFCIRGNTTWRIRSPTRPPPVIAAPTDTAIKIMAAAWALRSCS